MYAPPCELIPPRLSASATSCRSLAPPRPNDRVSHFALKLIHGHMQPPLKINRTRLCSSLQATCARWGAIPGSSGMRRLALSEEDRYVRDWLVAECTALGCTIKVDDMGNIFATRPGTACNSNAPPIAMGSHLDTQPAGGRYDGILGVHAALEALRTLNENHVQTYSPIAVVDWTNEEGARFPGAMMASGVWSQQSSTGLQACHQIRDPAGITFFDALEKMGYHGATPCDYRRNPLAAHFELHIEQGPILEQQNKKIGIVTGVQAMKWHRIRVEGVEGHAGTTPMAGRGDALVTASRMIQAVRDTAQETSLGVATVGVITCDTHSQATIPGGVEFVVDVRCSTDQMVDDLVAAIFRAFEMIIAEESNTTYTITRIWGLPESWFNSQCIESVRRAAMKLVGEDLCIEMLSRAGHDSAWTSKVAPTTMIFVPSKDGISHNPNEFTSDEDCAIGAQVLLDAVLEYDGEIKRAATAAVGHS